MKSNFLHIETSFYIFFDGQKFEKIKRHIFVLAFRKFSAQYRLRWYVLNMLSSWCRRTETHWEHKAWSDEELNISHEQLNLLLMVSSIMKYHIF